MPDTTDRRYAELSRGVLVVLSSAPDGLDVSNVLDQLHAALPPTSSELQDSLKDPAVSRYEEAVRFSTRALVRAGWLTKSAHAWRVTPVGREALEKLSDPLAFYTFAERQRDLKTLEAPTSDIGDIFAGCFLSLAGGLVGAIIGTLVLLARMLPDPSIGLAIGFAAAFVVGVVVGLIAMFPLAAIAPSFGRAAENVWLSTTALAAGIAAALTPSLLIAVDGGV